MLLETSYKALENGEVTSFCNQILLLIPRVAGLPIADVSGTKTSVYTGSFTDDYKCSYFKDPEAASKHAVAGISASMLSGRLSWFFNFTGPSATLDTACSSSLVALDMGCQSLLSENSNMACPFQSRQ
jgi:acyl transferase domain-containing protein